MTDFECSFKSTEVNVTQTQYLGLGSTYPNYVIVLSLTQELENSYLFEGTLVQQLFRFREEYKPGRGVYGQGEGKKVVQNYVVLRERFSTRLHRWVRT